MGKIILAKDLRPQLHMKYFDYSVNDYPFKETLENLYGCKLADLHLYMGIFERFKRDNDQMSLAHKVFYSNFEEKIKPIYVKFIKNFISKIFGKHKFYYQLIPTFRVGLPGNVFVGEFHKDSSYNHQNYEVNFNLGLANYEGNAALKTQIMPASDKWKKLSCPYGKIFSFDHIDCLHGSEPNLGNKTMVSFDFRLALSELYFDSPAKSLNMKSEFKPGSYFSSEIV